MAWFRFADSRHVFQDLSQRLRLQSQDRRFRLAQRFSHCLDDIFVANRTNVALGLRNDEIRL